MTDREPQPGDGPDYHAEHAAWRFRQTGPSTDELLGVAPDWCDGQAVDEYMAAKRATSDWYTNAMNKGLDGVLDAAIKQISDLIRERDDMQAEVVRLRAEAQEAIDRYNNNGFKRERDEARAEVERLRAECSETFREGMLGMREAQQAHLAALHCDCGWCRGETKANGSCGCWFCEHRRMNKEMEDQ